MNISDKSSCGGYFSTGFSSQYIARGMYDELERSLKRCGCAIFYNHCSGLISVRTGQELIMELNSQEKGTRGHLSTFSKQVAATRQRLEALCAKAFKPLPVKAMASMPALKPLSAMAGDLASCRASIPTKRAGGSAPSNLRTARGRAHEFEDLLSSVSPHSAFPLIDGIKEAITCDFRAFQKSFSDLSKNFTEKKAGESAQLIKTAAVVNAAQLTPAVFVRPQHKAVTRASLLHQAALTDSGESADARIANPPHTSERPLYLFPEKDALHACLNDHPLINFSPYLSDKGVVDALANSMANKEINDFGVNVEIFQVLSDYEGKLKLASDTVLQSLHLCIEKAAKDCAKSAPKAQPQPLADYLDDIDTDDDELREIDDDFDLID